MHDSELREALITYIKDLKVRKVKVLRDYSALEATRSREKGKPAPNKAWVKSLNSQLSDHSIVVYELNAHISHLEGILDD